MDQQANRLADWLAVEAAQRARFEHGAGPGVLSREVVATLDGLTQMRRMLAGELPHAAIASTLDFMLIEVERGRAVFQGAPRTSHFNPMGTVHGGWFATLLDSALGCAVHTLMPAGRAYTTAELSIKLVRAITPKVERVRAEGEVVHCGRQLATAEARLVGPDGTLYAHASTTCLVFDLPPAGR
ncbi:MAG: PaaI family thioesterase [Ideonella sp.]|nr:PaaI family thioesterase [Ideonella sp.]